MLLVLSAAPAAARPLLLISTENGPDHVQTRIVQRFVERVRECCADRVVVEHQLDGALYRDRDLPAALRQGRVAMGVVGTWHLDSAVPDVGVFLLPLFYGLSLEEARRVQDSPAIRLIDHRIETTLGVVVLGRWIELGFANLFTLTRAPLDPGRLGGLRIRSPGGIGNAWRLAELGAEPVTIAWTDLPRALQEGRVDGLITTFATLDSVEGWGSMITQAWTDHQTFSQYVPLVSEYFWRQLDEATRQDLRQAWESVVQEGRAMTQAAQDAARRRAEAAGLDIRQPDRQTRDRVRRHLLARQGNLLDRLGISREVLERTSRELAQE